DRPRPALRHRPRRGDRGGGPARPEGARQRARQRHQGREEQQDHLPGPLHLVHRAERPELGGEHGEGGRREPVVMRKPSSAGRLRAWHLAAGVVLLAALAAASLFIGVGDMTPAGLLHAREEDVRLLVESRLPRLLAVLLAGTAMSVAGLVMMHITGNRFVSPSTAGTTESATLGVLVATLFAGGEAVIVKMALAVACALAGTFVFMTLLRRLTFRDMILVPLVGIMFGGVIGAATTFVAYRYDLLQTLGAWTSGDFSAVLRGRYELLWLAG